MSLSNLTEKHSNKVGDNLKDVKIVHKDELYHYGVKGMKWGYRKNPEVVAARANYKSAKKAYSKSYNSAYGYSSRHTIGQFTNKKKRAESDRRWEDAYNKAEKVNKAKDAYKQAKTKAKSAAKETSPYKEARDKQKSYLKQKHAIDAGSAMVNTILASTGSNLRVTPAMRKGAHYLHGRKYTKDWLNM